MEAHDLIYFKELIKYFIGDSLDASTKELITEKTTLTDIIDNYYKGQEDPDDV